MKLQSSISSNRIKSKLKTSINWQGVSPELKNLRWEGGAYVNRPHPHQPRGEVSTEGRLSFEEEFQTAINSSVELERLDAKQK